MVRHDHSALNRKLVRDMRGNAMQFLAMVLLCFLGTWVFAGLDANWRMEDKTFEDWISEGKLCDFWVSTSVLDRQDVYRIKAVDGVGDVQERITLTVECPELDGEVTAALHAFSGTPRMNIPRMRDGSALKEGDLRGCLVEEQFAQAQGLHTGDRLRVRIQDVERDLIVRGTALSPEYLITSNDMAPDPSSYGFIITMADAFPEYPVNQLLVSMNPGAAMDSAEREISDIVPSAVIQSQSTHASTVQARNFVHLFRNMSYLFPVLAYFVAAMVVMSTISRLMDTQRIQMGTLKALGYDNRLIRRHYLAYALWPSLLGSLIGLFSAQVTLPPVLWRMVATNMRVPEIRMAPISALSWGMAGAEAALAVLLCVRHEERLAKEPAAELLRPRPPKSGERILLERFRLLWDRLSFNSKMIIRNIFRNKGRTLMSMLGMLFCNMLIICSFGLQESIPWFVNEYFEGTIGYDIRLDLKTGQGGTLESYMARLDAERVDGTMSMSVSMRTPDVTRTVSLNVLNDDIILLRLGENHTPMEMPDEGVVLTAKLADKLKVGIGDTVELWLSGETRGITLRVENAAQINIGQEAYMSKTAWEKLRKGGYTPTAILIRGATERGMRQIDDLDEVDKTRIPADQMSQTMRIMDSATGAFSILSAVALGLAFVICYNMGLLNFTERTREYATLKVLGYHQKEIRRLMLRENSLVAVAGVGAGIVPGIMLVRIILKMCEFDSMIFSPHITWPTVALSSLATFAFTWLIQRFLTRKVKTIDMVEALKSVE